MGDDGAGRDLAGAGAEDAVEPDQDVAVVRAAVVDTHHGVTSESGARVVAVDHRVLRAGIAARSLLERGAGERVLPGRLCGFRERDTRIDVARCHLQHPVAAENRKSGLVARCRDIRAGDLCDAADEPLSVLSGRDVAAVNQDVAVRLQRPPDRRQSAVVLVKRRVAQRVGAEMEPSRLAMRDDVDRRDVASPLERRRNLGEPALSAAQQYNLEVGIYPGDQRIEIVDVAIDEYDCRASGPRLGYGAVCAAGKEVGKACRAIVQGKVAAGPKAVRRRRGDGRRCGDLREIRLCLVRCVGVAVRPFDGRGHRFDRGLGSRAVEGDPGLERAICDRAAQPAGVRCRCTVVRRGRAGRCLHFSHGRRVTSIREMHFPARPIHWTS